MDDLPPEYCSSSARWVVHPPHGSASAYRIVIDRAAGESIAEHARRQAPEECCGILLGRRIGADHVVEQVRPAANVAERERHRRYEIDPAAVMSAVLDAEETGRHVIGFYHSHPDGSSRPSRLDAALAWPGCSYVIVTQADEYRRLVSWRCRDGGGFAHERIAGSSNE